MINLNTLLELSNWSWGILGLVLLYALIEYLWIEGRHRGLSLQRWLFSLPGSMQLGVGICVLVTGICIRSFTIGVWRAFRWTPVPDYPAVMLGTAIGCVGMLCIIRVISRPRYGHKLWGFGLACVLVYVSTALIWHG